MSCCTWVTVLVATLMVPRPLTEIEPESLTRYLPETPNSEQVLMLTMSFGSMKTTARFGVDTWIGIKQP